MINRLGARTRISTLYCTNIVGTVKEEEDMSMEQKMVNLTKFQVWYEHSSMSFSTGKRPYEK